MKGAALRPEAFALPSRARLRHRTITSVFRLTTGFFSLAAPRRRRSLIGTDVWGNISIRTIEPAGRRTEGFFEHGNEYDGTQRVVHGQIRPCTDFRYDPARRRAVARRGDDA